MTSLLNITDLSIAFPGRQNHLLLAVNSLSMQINKGEVFGLVGESGSGKSMTALSILNLLPRPGQTVSGQIFFEGRDLLRLAPTEMQKIRGAQISMIFQEPMTSLNPVFTIGRQVAETIVAHHAQPRQQAWKSAITLLERVGIPDPQNRVKSYPHQLSGGQRQRVMIAMALSLSPRLIIADEPTTALDVTIQAQILGLLKKLQSQTNTACLLITHNLAVVAQMADQVAVMYTGRLMEQAPVKDLFREQLHPYTKGLMACLPDRAQPGSLLPTIAGMVPPLDQLPSGCPFSDRCQCKLPHCHEAIPALVQVSPGRLVRCFRYHGQTEDSSAIAIKVDEMRADENCAVPAPTEPAAGLKPKSRRLLLQIKGLTKRYPVGAGFMKSRQSWLTAVDNVDLTIREGEVLSLVGESGCGKSTLSRLALALETPSQGQIFFENQDLTTLSRSQLKHLRRRMQIVFQDPATSLNPRQTVGDILSEPFYIHGDDHKDQIKQKVAALMEQVGLNPDQARRYPHQFSGGQRQRIGIARALALKPKLVVADEPVSALDVSIQAQIINLLMELKNSFDLTYLFVSHDLSVVRHISDRLAVMYLGKIMELGPAGHFHQESSPRKVCLHPYTSLLWQAAPVVNPEQPLKAPQEGNAALGTMSITGCRFYPRCREAQAICRTKAPALKLVSPEHYSACHFR